MSQTEISQTKLKNPAKTLCTMQLVFTGLIIVMICLLIPCGIEIYAFRQKAIDNMPEGYEFPMMSDFILTIKASLVLGFIDLFLRTYLSQCLQSFCKVQDDIVQRQARSEKMATMIYRIIYYTVATIYGYKVLSETTFQTKWLGGTGVDFNEFLEGYPYVKITPLLKNYCLITMGYHLGSCYPLIYSYSVRKNDFLEMALHHFACLFMYFGCYNINVPGGICLVNFVHDIADIPSSISRLMGETKFKNTTAAVFVFNMVLWTYSRLFVLPIITYQIICYATEKAPALNPKFPQIFGFVMCCLIVLHAYWLNIFFQIIFKFSRDGSNEDLVQDNRPKKNTKWVMKKNY